MQKNKHKLKCLAAKMSITIGLQEKFCQFLKSIFKKGMRYQSRRRCNWSVYRVFRFFNRIFRPGRHTRPLSLPLHLRSELVPKSTSWLQKASILQVIWGGTNFFNQFLLEYTPSSNKTYAVAELPSIFCVFEGVCSAVGGVGRRVYPIPGSWFESPAQANQAFYPSTVDELIPDLSGKDKAWTYSSSTTIHCTA